VLPGAMGLAADLFGAGAVPVLLAALALLLWALVARLPWPRT